MPNIFNMDQLIYGIKEGVKESILDGLKGAALTFLKWIARGVIANSYWICLTACIIALLLYIAGVKKAGKYVSISLILFFILQAVSLAL